MIIKTVIAAAVAVVMLTASDRIGSAIDVPLPGVEIADAHFELCVSTYVPRKAVSKPGSKRSGGGGYTKRVCTPTGIHSHGRKKDSGAKRSANYYTTRASRIACMFVPIPWICGG